MKFHFKKFVLQNWNKTRVRVNKREALEPVPNDEEDIQQKRAYPRPVPGSNSILTKHTEVSFKTFFIHRR